MQNSTTDWKLAIGLGAAALLLAAVPSPAVHVRLFVLTGQSNSLGPTNAPDDTDPSPGIDAADDRVHFFWHNVANATTTIGASGGTSTTLQEQQGGYYPGSATHWGPEIACARTLYRAGVRDFGFIKASRGGGGNTYWSKAHGGHMYAHVTSTVHQATTDLTAKGHTFEIVALLYLQGESDNAGEAAAASSRLATLTSNLRADLPNAANMHVVVGGIAAAGTNRDTVRTQQSALAAGDSTIDYFETVDLRDRLYDNLHFDKAAKLEVGRRYAHAFLDAEVAARDYGRLVFIGDSITQGGNAQPSYRYEVFRHLATNEATYTFVGSVNGAYASGAVPTPDWNGLSFTNTHDGHWGWRAFWENGRVPLPSSRTSNNRGTGTVRAWTGQTNRYELNSAGNWVDYGGPTYTQDTAVVMIGINDLGGGSPTNQVLADVETMVRQLQAANADSTIFLTSITRVGSGHSQYPSLNNTIDAYNKHLRAAAPAWAAGGSAVFPIDVTTGFAADAMTYDNVHPNATGETHIGERIAVAMGLRVVAGAGDGTERTPASRDSSEFASKFNGNEIHDGSSYINGWSDDQVAEALRADGSLNISNTTVSSDAYVNGTASSAAGSTWNDGNNGSWTLETRIKFRSIDNGFVLWLGTDSNRILVEIYDTYTRDFGNNTFTTPHEPNADEQFHTYRVAHDASDAVYHVWRDDVRLTPPQGVGLDGGSDSRMLLGDYTRDIFGNGFDVDIEYVRYDQSGSYAPRTLPHATVITLK